MNKCIVVLAAIIVSLGTLCAIQWGRLKARQQQSSVLASDLEQKSKQLEDLNAAHQHAEEHKRELLRANDELAAQVSTQRTAQAEAPATKPPVATPAVSDTSSPATNAGGLGAMLSKMMSDPDTKKFIRNQQRMMMDQLYKPLIKQLGMTPEEAATFKDLLADGTMKNAERATSLFGNGSTNRAQLAIEMAAEQKGADEQIKALLGDDRYALFKSYQETAGERMQLNMFRQQNDAGEYPINDFQVEQLLGFMKDEKPTIAAAMNPASTGGDPAAAMDAMLSEDKAEQLFQSQETANQRIFERARSVLSPDQLRSFGEFQTNQLQMMRMGMSMARKLMAPSSSTPGAPSSEPGQ